MILTKTLLILCLVAFAYGQTGFNVDPTYDGEETGVNYIDYVPYDDSDAIEEFGETLDRSLQSVTPTRRFVISTLYFLIAAVSLVMCVIALLTTHRCMTLEYSQKVLMQNIVVSCLFLMIALVFSAQYRLIESWLIGSAMCKLVNCLKVFAICAQVFFVVALCVDYMALRKWPQIGEIARTFLEIGVIVFGWLFALCFSSPVLVFSEVSETFDVERCEMVFTHPEELYDLPQRDPYDTLGSDTINTAKKSNFDFDIFKNSSPNVMDIPECKDHYNPSYHTWIMASFALNYAVPVFVCLLTYLLHKLLETPSMPVFSDSVLPPIHGRGFTAKIIKRRRSSNSQAPETRCMPAGVWVTAVCLIYFICWLPFYAYHLGRIPGLPISLITCANFRDYSFVQGFLSCILLPALVISYSRPVVLGSRSKTATTSSTSSFASAASGNSNRKSTGSGTTSDGENPHYEVPLLQQKRARPPATSVV